MTTNVENNDGIIDRIWKDRIERALKHASRTIDHRQRRDAIPFLANLAEQIQQTQHIRRPRIIDEPIMNNKQSILYTNCSYEEITGEKLISSISILPQIDPLPVMFTYVPLQRNFLCDTVTNLSDLILDEGDEDIRNILDTVQSDSSQSNRVHFSNPKRIRRRSNTYDKNNELILDEEHLIELLKRLKQQTFDDYSNLFDTLIKLYPSSADLIRDRFTTIFESKTPLSKEFIPNIDNASIALDTTVENTLHSYFMLFCRRCHRYDCFLHKDKQATPNLNNASKTNTSIYNPCSPHCFRIMCKEKKIELRRSYSEIADHRSSRISSNGYHSKHPRYVMMKSDPITSVNYINSHNSLSIKSSLNRQLIDEISSWSANEKSLFRVFQTIYGNNICLIADLLDKPCSQVYALYIKEMENHERKSDLQRQNSETSTSTIGSFSAVNSTTSSDSMGMKTNENIQSATSSNGEELILSNGKHEQNSTSSRSSSSRRSHSLSFRRQQLLFNHHQNGSSSEKKRHNYYPCDHDSSIPCNEHCYCVRSGNFCEKFCSCSTTKCDNRFPGCRCRSSCTTKQCACYAAGRECDPDLCTSCGADDFRMINNEMKTCSTSSCHNVAIQRSLHKPLLLAESDVAGWGIFTQVNIQRNEFIAEYCGEIVTQDEGELRGRMYDAIGTSFLFDLNEEYMVDATRRGNKIRFANHSINPNCYAKIILVNGDHRIGIYSKRSIMAGEELFFDYRYGANHHLRFVGVEKNVSTDTIDT